MVACFDQTIWLVYLLFTLIILFMRSMSHSQFSSLIRRNFEDVFRVLARTVASFFSIAFCQIRWLMNSHNCRQLHCESGSECLPLSIGNIPFLWQYTMGQDAAISKPGTVLTDPDRCLHYCQNLKSLSRLETDFSRAC